MIRLDYQRRAVERIMEKVAALGVDDREAVRFMLGRDTFCTVGDLSKGISGYAGGAAQVKWGSATKSLLSAQIVAKGGSGGTGFKPRIRDWVYVEMATHSPSEAEVEEVYQSVLSRIAGGQSS